MHKGVKQECKSGKLGGRKVVVEVQAAKWLSKAGRLKQAVSF
jgi:hypothetical protein